MTYNEPGLETVILQKLEAMEDFLKSFMSSLEEPPQKKGRMVKVKAKRGGRIEKWHKGINDPVRQYEALCTIQTDPLNPDPWNLYTVRAPVEGILHDIKAEKGTWVGAGETIAEIFQKTII